MKKTLIAAFISILLITVIMLIGNIIIIGDKLAVLFPFGDVVFYILIAVLLGVFIIRPFLYVFFAPELPALDENGLDSLSDKELFDYGMNLAKNNGYIGEENLRKNHYLELKNFLERNYGEKDMTISKITEEIESRLSLLNGDIRKEALTAFTITGLSQNGKFDFISLLIINFRLIKKLVKNTGFRPSYRQLIKVYYNVLASAILTNLSEEILDDIDMTFIAEKVRIPGFVMTSVLDGTFSALMTLRIGYITKNYIMKGNKSFNKKTARKYGFVNARKDIAGIVSEGKDVIVKTGGGFFKSMFGKQAAAE